MITKLNRGIGRTLAVAAAGSSIARITQLACAVITIPLTVDALGGVACYGTWVTITSIFMVLSLSDLGLSNGMSRLIARARGKNLPLGRLMKTMLYAEIIAGLCIMLATAPLAIWLPSLLQTHSTDALVLIHAILIKGLSTALVMPFKLSIPILTGHQRYGLHVVGDTLASVVSMVGILVVATVGDLDYRSLALVTGVGALTGAVAGYILAKRSIPNWGFGSSKPDIRYLRLGLGYGFASLIVTFAFAISIQGTTIILGLSGDTKWAGIWALATFVTNQVSHIGASISAPFTTYAAQFGAQRNIASLNSPIVGVALIIGAFVATQAVGAALFGTELIEYVLPAIHQEGESTNLTYITAGLMAVLALMLPLTVTRNYLLGTKSHWSVAWWNVSASITSVMILAATLQAIQVWAAVLSRSVFLLVPALGLYLPAMRRLLGKQFKYFALKFSVALGWPVLIAGVIVNLHLINNIYINNLLIRIVIYLGLTGIGFATFIRFFGLLVFVSSKRNDDHS